VIATNLGMVGGCPHQLFITYAKFIVGIIQGFRLIGGDGVIYFGLFHGKSKSSLQLC
jgi:hypothetical protein